MVGPGRKERCMAPGSIYMLLIGVKICTRGMAMLRVSGKRLLSFTVDTFRILVILPPNFSEEIWAHKVEVAGAAVLAVRDDGTLLVARVFVAAFSARVAAVGSMNPAVFFVRKKANAGATFLASRLRVSACGDSVVAVVAVCAILRDELCKLVVECGKLRCDVGGGGGGARTDSSLMVSMVLEGAVDGF